MTLFSTPPPLIMGILNVTPDSFFDGGEHNTLANAQQHFNKLVKEGAGMIDIGAVSTRPQALTISEEEEARRLLPFLEALYQQGAHKTIPISVDTEKPFIAEKALKLGAYLINDVSGFEDPLMQDIVKTYDAQLCVVHRQGNSQTMQLNPYYPKGILYDLMKWFEQKIQKLLKKGINEKNIILDPGIGFGKTPEDNIKILNNISLFKSFGLRVLVGISRKSFMTHYTQKPSQDLLASTLSLNTLLAQQGVDILRVHDVEPHVQAFKCLQAFYALKACS